MWFDPISVSLSVVLENVLPVMGHDIVLCWRNIMMYFFYFKAGFVLCCRKIYKVCVA